MDSKFLFELLSQPTAPYRESQVLNLLEGYLKKHKVAYFKDSIGNIVAGVENKKAYLKLVRTRTKEPLRIFMAHTDHPGFHGVRWKDKGLLEFKWHGGSPRKFLEGAPVWLSTSKGLFGKGEMVSAVLNERGTAIESGVVQVKGLEGDAKEFYGGFSFREPVWQEAELLYTKAADDLIGCFAIATLAAKLKKNRSFIGLFTRAEEVGFIGAIGHFELGWLKNPSREVVCISLETSRTLPAAEIGKGPIVRLGDRMTVFDPAGVNELWEVAKKTLKDSYQRRIMDGGACEASASTAYGIRSIGISVPLGNYHNQSLQGGPDSRGEDGPAPEYVHDKDLQGMLKLCEGLMAKTVSFQDPWKKRRTDFQKSFRAAKTLLKLA